MTDLASMQRALADALRTTTSLVDRQESAVFAEGIASGNERLSPAMQLDIYREQFLMRHLDVLRDDFRAVERLLGDAGFEALALAYLGAYPPSSFTLRDLGGRMTRFLAQTPPWSDDGLLADLARTEWAFVDAFDAPNAPLLEIGAIAAIEEDAWPMARIVFQPSLQRLSLGHAAHDYRIAVRDGAAVAALHRPEPRVSYVVVYRGAERLQCLDVDAEAFALLDELARGAQLGEACERVASSSGATPTAFEEKVGAWFQEWTALGWISTVELI